MKRREFIKKTIRTTIKAAALSVSPLLFNYHCSQSTEEVKIGYIPITDAAPLLIAYINKYFQDEGLKIRKPVLIRGWSSLVESFLAQKVNLVHLLIPIPIWMRYKNQSPAKIIAWDHTNGSAITVGGHSGINTFADLGGKIIAVPYWYSMHNVILQAGLRKFGLKALIRPQNSTLKPDEVNLVILPPPEE